MHVVRYVRAYDYVRIVDVFSREIQSYVQFRVNFHDVYLTPCYTVCYLLVHERKKRYSLP